MPTRIAALLLSCSAALVLGGAPEAVADPGNGAAVCHGSVESGVEVDTCTGNPNPPAAADPGGIRVVPEFCIGLGAGGCDGD